jgi:L-amino acid N-acyltransferase YncA
MSTSTVTIVRASQDSDIPAITAIYAHYVLNSTATFETTVPSEAEMAARRADVLAKGLPYLVIEVGGEIMGFAYGNWFKPRAAYRFSVENSIYLNHQAGGKGLGRALLGELLTQFERVGIRKVMAVIGGSENLASIGLHKALGFTPAGLIDGAGWKQERWLDLVLMQRTLGAGSSQPPIYG